MRPDLPPITPALGVSRSPDLFGALRRQLLLIVICFVIGGLAGDHFAHLRNV